MSGCPICAEPLRVGPVPRAGRDSDDYDCPNCGIYLLSRTLQAMLSSGAYDQRRRAILSYAIRRLERHDDRPLVSTDFAKAVVESNQLPGVEEQLENLVLYLGRALPE